VDQIESLGVLLIGIGVIGGSIATTQAFSEAVLPSVIIIAIGIAVTLIGRYR
jgi:nucleoside phosphorylase